MGLSDFMKESVYEMFSGEAYQGSDLSQKEQQEKIDKQQASVAKQAVQGLATGVQSKMYSNQAIADSPMPDKQTQANAAETPNKQQHVVADKKSNKSQQADTKMIVVANTPNNQHHVNRSTQNKTTNNQHHVNQYYVNRSVQVNSTRQTMQTRRPQMPNRQQRVAVGVQSRMRSNQTAADLTTSRNERRLPSTLANIHKEKDDLQMGE